MISPTLILTLILLLYVGVIYLLLQINILSCFMDEEIKKSKRAMEELVSKKVKISQKELEDLKGILQSHSKTLSFLIKKQEEVTNRVTNLSLTLIPKKQPVKENSK